jgi:hypothetical protein
VHLKKKSDIRTPKLCEAIYCELGETACGLLWKKSGLGHVDMPVFLIARKIFRD